MSRVFLTGGSGLIGGALAKRLVARGDEVVALARSAESAGALEAIGAAVVRGDVLDEAGMAEGMAGCAVAYHVAGVNTMCPTDPAELIHVNVRGAEAAVRAAARAGVDRVVLTSSAAALGEAEGTVGSETSPHRGSYLSVYERSKHEGELAAFAAAAIAGIPLVSVNPSSVQGPGRAGGTGRILIAYLNGRLRGFVDTTLSLVDIDDCVEAHVLAAEKGVPGERYVISGATISARKALEIVTEVSGVHRDVRILPPAVAKVAGTAVEGVFKLRGRKPPFCREMVRTLLHGHRYDGSKAARELGPGVHAGRGDVPAHDRVGRAAKGSSPPDRARGRVPQVLTTCEPRRLPTWRTTPIATARRGTRPPRTSSTSIPPSPSRPTTRVSSRATTSIATRPRRSSSPTSRAASPRSRPAASATGASARAPRRRPTSPEKEVERRFSEGVERSPTSD